MTNESQRKDLLILDLRKQVSELLRYPHLIICILLGSLLSLHSLATSLLPSLPSPTLFLHSLLIPTIILSDNGNI